MLSNQIRKIYGNHNAYKSFMSFIKDNTGEVMPPFAPVLFHSVNMHDEHSEEINSQRLHKAIMRKLCNEFKTDISSVDSFNDELQSYLSIYTRTQTQNTVNNSWTTRYIENKMETETEKL